MKKKSALECANLICRDNLYLLQEVEIKEILAEWQKDKDRIVSLENKLSKK